MPGALVHTTTEETLMALEPHNPAITSAGDPVACTLGAADLSQQAERWRRLLTRAAIARLETSHGIRIEFLAGAGIADELEQLVAVESKCCAWAVWSVAAVAGHVVLDVTSTGDGIAAIHSMLTES
jgi:hypothetical protein